MSTHCVFGLRHPVPGMGWMFVADPDGNWIELFGTL